MIRGSTSFYDVAVAGGGPAGATLSRTLAGWGLRVILCEAAGGPRRKPGEVLSSTIYPVLRRFGVAGSDLAQGDFSAPCLGIRAIWGSDKESLRDDRDGRDGCGFTIDRRALDAHLADLAISAGVEWRWGLRVESVTRDGAAWRIETRASHGESHVSRAAAEPTEISARLLVDATGRIGALARRLGARRRTHDRLLAFGLARTLKASVPARAPGWLRVEAAEDGWWYGIDTPDGRRQVMFVTDAAARRQHARNPVHELRVRLERTVAMGNWFEAESTPVTPLPMVDASSACLDAAAGAGWVAIGDAATSFDPITAQGIPQAFASALAAAHAIRRHLAGQVGTLEVYAAMAIATWLRSTVARAAVYVVEGRWEGAPFWRRRQPPPAGRPVARPEATNASMVDVGQR